MIDRRAEAFAEKILPPASVEHVLGDLAECSPTTTRYLINLASILPRVVWSQVRRRATIGFIVVNAVFTAIALSMALGRSDAFAALDWAVARAAVPWAIWIAGCALAAAYGPLERPERWNGRLFAATIAAVFGGAWMANVPLAPVAFGLGGLAGVFLLFALPTLMHGMPPPLTRETIAQHARIFQAQVRWRNAREALGVLVVVTANAGNLVETTTALARLGHVLGIAGALFVLVVLFTRAGARRVPTDADAGTLLEFHRREIVRQRDMLRAVPYWYLLPLVPGVIFILAAKATSLASALGALAVLAVAFAFVGWINAAAARFLEGQLRQVEALEGCGSRS